MIQCDETKPYCLRCQKQGAECDYSTPPARSRPTKHVVTRFIESHPDLISVDSLSSSMSLLLVADKLDELLRPANGDHTSRAKPPLGSSTNRALEALHHFHQATSTNTKLSTNMGVVMRKVTQLAFEVRHLFSHAFHHLLKLNPLDPTTHARPHRRRNNPPLHSPPRYKSLPTCRSIPLATDSEAILKRSIPRNKDQHGHSLLSLPLLDHPHLHAGRI